MKKYLFLLSVIGTLLAAFSVYSTNSIHSAAYNGDEQKVIALLNQKVDPDARDSFGGTALHAAMFQNNLRIVELLLDAGFDINAIGPRNGYTPAHDAVWANNLPALKILVERGADLTIKALDGNTPLEKAKQEQKTKLVNYLLQATNQ